MRHVIKLLILSAMIVSITACHQHNPLLQAPPEKIARLLNSVDFDYIENCSGLYLGDKKMQADEVIYNNCIIQSEQLAKRANDDNLIAGVNGEDFRDIAFFHRINKLNMQGFTEKTFMRIEPAEGQANTNNAN